MSGLRLLDGERTQTGVTDGLGYSQADRGFEPLPVPVDERDDRDRRTAQRRSQMRQVIEGGVRGRVENPVAQQGSYTGHVVGRRGVRRHTCSPTRKYPKDWCALISPRVLPQIPRIE